MHCFPFQHSPRFFIVRPDLSGTELLRYSDVADFIRQAETDNATAFMSDPVIEHPGEQFNVIRSGDTDHRRAWECIERKHVDS